MLLVGDDGQVVGFCFNDIWKSSSSSRLLERQERLGESLRRRQGEGRDKLEAKRKQVIYKKEELERSQLQKQFEVEKALRKRMKQLDAKQQRRQQETLGVATQNSFGEKDKERRRHSVEQAHRESNEAQSCSKTLNTLTERLEQGYSSHSSSCRAEWN